MEKNTVLLPDGVLGTAFKFSEHVICIEVMKNGRQLGSFCTDVGQFEEWDDEDLRSLIEQHVKSMEEASLKYTKEKQYVLDRYELQYYTHSDYLYCIDVLDNGKIVSSFCTDKDTFDEWMEDKEQLTNVVKEILANKK